MGVIQYIECCPECDSEKIIMTGDPEFNDGWTCETCGEEFCQPNMKIDE